MRTIFLNTTEEKTDPVCLMIEKENSFDSNKALNYFSIIRNEEELNRQKLNFKEPVITFNETLLSQAIKLENLFKK